MTHQEWADTYAYISSGCGRALTAKALEVYFDLLSDLPIDAMITAAQRVLMEHPWATFPSIAELRAAAIATVQGSVSDMSPAEAWTQAWDAIKRIDPESEGSIERGCKGLSPLVIEAMRAMGVLSLCFDKGPVGILRTQFMQIFQQLSAREKRQALFPPELKKTIENGPPGMVAGAIAQIGQMPKG